MVCNWGVLGAGFIANRAMLAAIQHSSQARVLAVASRDEQRTLATWAEAGARRSRVKPMSAQKPASWAYSEEFIAENEVIQKARVRSEEMGCVPVMPGTGAALRLLAAAAQAKSVVEVGPLGGCLRWLSDLTEAERRAVFAMDLRALWGAHAHPFLIYTFALRTGPGWSLPYMKVYVETMKGLEFIDIET